jgi:hypothetical protein
MKNSTNFVSTSKTSNCKIFFCHLQKKENTYMLAINYRVKLFINKNGSKKWQTNILKKNNKDNMRMLNIALEIKKPTI